METGRRIWSSFIAGPPNSLSSSSIVGKFPFKSAGRDSASLYSEIPIGVVVFNYFTVDGVSANFALMNNLSPIANISQYPLQAGGAMIPANNFLGTFSNLVSPDALQEFKIQTSTFAPEFGRSPGAQIGLVTRSGTNRYSGSLFEYFRNDNTDANDWFANRQALPKAPLRFNDFGGSLGGPVRIPHLYDGHDRTFFFLSIEDLVTLQPQPPVSFPCRR